MVKRLQRLTKRTGQTSMFALAILASSFTTTSALARGESKRVHVSKSTAQVRIERDIAELMSQYRVPGVSIVLLREGKIAWQSGFGVVKKGAEPIKFDTQFQAASISKTITSFACMRMVEMGTLKLDEDVNLLLRSWQVPPSDLSLNSPVTLRGLLSHTAGINVDGFDGYASGTTVPNLIQILDGAPPSNSEAVRIKHMPGDIYEYSGGGYTIIQQLLIDKTREPFPGLMQRLVLKPLHMRDSAFDQPLPNQRQTKAAVPHDANGEPLKGGAHIYPELAAAGLWTTAPDLARFAIAMQAALNGKSGALLNAAGAKLMVTPVKNHSALGLERYGEIQNAYFVQTGSNEGFRSVLLFFPDGNGVVIMTNSDNGYTFFKSLIPRIAAEYGWTDRKPIAMFE
jgi:CubicO group peptidase (beta-lactamase class C family)